MLIVSAILFPGLLEGQTTWFEHEFNRGDLSRDWSAGSPDWRLEGGALRITTPLYDQLLSSSWYLYNTRPFAVVLRVPRNDRYGFRLERGKRFSIRLGVQSSTDLWVWEELYERNYMMQIELQ
ncbi:hypothetical protein D4R75_01945 [bacterium]|nr:MAG: hypothetical protein D4R75_01945 [bacterium]